jgi:hypothetical protein
VNVEDHESCSGESRNHTAIGWFGQWSNGLSYYGSVPNLRWLKDCNSALNPENICFIDCEGLALIKSLMGQGVLQINAPLFVAEQIRKCEATEGD